MSQGNDPASFQEGKVLHAEVNIGRNAIGTVGSHESRVPSIELHTLAMKQCYWDLGFAVFRRYVDPCASVLGSVKT